MLAPLNFILESVPAVITDRQHEVALQRTCSRYKTYIPMTDFFWIVIWKAQRL